MWHVINDDQFFITTSCFNYYKYASYNYFTIYCNDKYKIIIYYYEYIVAII